MTPDRPVLAGVAASAASSAAIRWAAQQARRRGTALHLLHACELDVVSPGPRDELRLVHAHRVLRRAADVARQRAPGVRVEQAVRLGTAVDRLLAGAAGAVLVVLGSPGPGGPPVGSVVLRVAAGAVCPVVVVPGQRPWTGPIAVGHDASVSSGHALRFALEEATALGVPVRVVRACRPGEPGPAAHIAVWARKYPGLEITAQVVPDVSASRALLLAVPDARLIVVGTRGRGPVAGGVLGSTGSALLAHAACPVAVVR
ncbi:universal stress protein [Amycolatopsis lexingtonensis]|uniref:universal stress protein n=1 Tax=Amycolatopsis lexingtonensis TaxID=218822 RepID=UPI003F713305